MLDEQRLVEILDRAAGRTEEQVMELVAALRPRPAPPDLFRKLPAPAPARQAEPPGSGQFRTLQPETWVMESREVAATAALVPEPELPLPAPPAPPPRPAGRLEPIAEQRHVPRGKDGETTAANLTLRCQAHNLYAAEKDYGREHIARMIARSTSRAGESVGTSPFRVRRSQPPRPALPGKPGAGMQPQPRPRLRRARVAATATATDAGM